LPPAECRRFQNVTGLTGPRAQVESTEVGQNVRESNEESQIAKRQTAAKCMGAEGLAGLGRVVET